MSIILITGSCGLVGSEAVEHFSKKGFDIVGVDNNIRKSFFGKDGDNTQIKNYLKKKIKNYTHYDYDIRDSNSIKKLFKKYKRNLSLIIHSASQPSHDWAKNQPIVDYHINATSTLQLLEFTKIYSPQTPFIFMSTNKVYGDNPNKLPLIKKNKRWEISKRHKYFGGIDENMSLDDCTHSFFGTSKTYADLIVQEYGKNIKLKTCCFRAGCITGPNHAGAKLHGFLSYLVKSAIQKKSYEIIGYQGRQVRDNIHSKDLVNCFWEFYKKPKYGEVYNIGGGRKSNCSILEALKYIEKKKKIKIKKIYKKQNRIGDHIWYISSLKKFTKHYPGWKQKYSNDMIIDELLSTIND